MANVVLVEDDGELRRSLGDCLALMGHSAQGVGSAIEFYQLLARETFDVAVVDINLPHYDGFSVIEYLAKNSELAIIVTSARTALEDRVRGYRSGVDIYMTKPIDPEELSAAIEGLSKKRKGRAGKDGPVWTCSLETMSLTAPNGRQVDLTRREMLFLSRIAGREDGSVSRAALLEVLGYEEGPGPGPRKLDTLVSRLRTKVRGRTGLALPVDTVQGSGFAVSAAIIATD